MRKFIRNEIQSLSNKPNLKLVLKNSSYFFSEKMTKVLFGFVLQTWVSRHLGPLQMGVYTYVTDFVLLFVPIVLFGMDDPLVRELVSHQRHEKAIGTVFYFRLVVGFVSWLALCLTIWFIRGTSDTIFYYSIFFGTMLIFRCLDTFSSHFHARMMIKELVSSRQKAYLLASGVKFAGLLAKFGTFFFILNYYFQLFIEKIFVVFKYYKTEKHKLVFDREILKSLVLLSYPIALTGFFTIGESRLGTFFLSKYYDLTIVGQLGVGKSLLDISEFLAGSICISVYPVIIKAHQGDNNESDRKMIHLYSGLFYYGLSLWLLSALFSPYVINLLYGNRYIESSTAVTFGSLAAIITFLNIARLKWYILQNKTNLWLALCIGAFIINTILQFFLTKELGLKASFISKIISHTSINLLACTLSGTIRQDLKNVTKGIASPFIYIKRRFRV